MATVKLTSTPMSDAATAFKEQRYAEAVLLYTQAIEEERSETQHNNVANTPASSVIVRAHSNRSAAYAMLNQYENALRDAEACLRLCPDFAKGWARKATALHGLKRYQDAAAAYTEAARRPERTGAADPVQYQREAAEMTKLAQSGRGVVGEEDKDLYYVQKYSGEASKASKEGKFEQAVELTTKAIKHERQRRAAGLSLSSDSAPPGQKDGDINNSNNYPLLAVLLCNRSSLLNNMSKKAITEETKRKQLDSSLEDAEESVSVCNTYPRGQARLIVALLAVDRLRSARNALTAALQLLPSDVTQKNDNMRSAKTAVLEAEAEADAAAAKEEEKMKEEKRQLEAALQSRGCVGDSVQVNDMKKRRVELDANGVPIVGMAAAMAVKHSVSYEHCRFCSMSGHSYATCPLRRQQGGR